MIRLSIMNGKRSFFKKIFSTLFVTIFPYQILKTKNNKRKIITKRFAKIWILSSDDI